MLTSPDRVASSQVGTGVVPTRQARGGPRAGGPRRQTVRNRIARAAGAAVGLAAAMVLPACSWSSTCSVSQITTESLPDAIVGQVYSFTLTHNCSGKEAASWALLRGNLPPGITLGYDGRLFGTPTAAGSFFFEVSLSLTSRGSGGVIYDSGSDSRPYTLTVRP